MSVISQIIVAINTDDYSKRHINRHLKNIYNNSTPQEKSLLDSFMISMCGWSFQTLMEREK